LLATTIGQRVAFAEAAQTGRLVSETDGGERAALEVTALVAEIDSLGLGRIVR
jgi:chromosome partitioning protein